MHSSDFSIATPPARKLLPPSSLRISVRLVKCSFPCPAGCTSRERRCGQHIFHASAQASVPERAERRPTPSAASGRYRPAPTSSLRRRRSRCGARDSRAVPIFSPELRRRRDEACPKPGRPPETDCYLKIPGRVCGSESGPVPSFFRRRPNGGRRCRSRRHRPRLVRRASAKA